MYRYLIRFIYFFLIITNICGSNNAIPFHTTEERNVFFKGLCHEAYYLTEERAQSEDFRRLYARVHEEIARSLNYNPLTGDNTDLLTYKQKKNRFFAGVFYLAQEYKIKTSEIFSRRLLKSPGFLLETFDDQCLLTILYGMGKIDEGLYIFTDECLKKLVENPSSHLNALKNALDYMELQRTNMYRIVYRNFCPERDAWIKRISSLLDVYYLDQISSKL
jgi:hypothetical protein